MRRYFAAILVAAFALPAVAHAQSWPTARPITMVVPFPPGPALDLVARLVGDKLDKALGQTVVVENKSGANGTIGSAMVARAAPDGYTLLAATAGTHVTAVHLMKNLPYDPVKDFTPLIAAVEPVTCLAVNSNAPFNTVEELIAYAKAHPDELSYGSSGVGSVFQMMGELFNQTAGVRIKHVPYRGVAPAMQDVIGGHIPMTFISVSNAMPATTDGRVKILRGAGADPLFEAAANPFDVGNHSGVQEAVLVVRILRAAGHAARYRHASQHRDHQGAACARRRAQARSQRHDHHRRHAGRIPGIDTGRHRTLRRHHQGRRHTTRIKSIVRNP